MAERVDEIEEERRRDGSKVWIAMVASAGG
jgi:hypothetical protein